MSPRVFNELLCLVDPSLRRKDTRLRLSVKRAEKLAITLRRLATDDSPVNSFCISSLSEHGSWDSVWYMRGTMGNSDAYVLKSPRRNQRLERNIARVHDLYLFLYTFRLFNCFGILKSNCPQLFAPQLFVQGTLSDKTLNLQRDSWHFEPFPNWWKWCVTVLQYEEMRFSVVVLQLIYGGHVPPTTPLGYATGMVIRNLTSTPTSTVPCSLSH